MKNKVKKDWNENYFIKKNKNRDLKKRKKKCERIEKEFFLIFSISINFII